MFQDFFWDTIATREIPEVPLPHYLPPNNKLTHIKMPIKESINMVNEMTLNSFKFIFYHPTLVLDEPSLFFVLFDWLSSEE